MKVKLYLTRLFNFQLRERINYNLILTVKNDLLIFIFTLKKRNKILIKRTKKLLLNFYILMYSFSFLLSKRETDIIIQYIFITREKT
jgi:hypothetical protein